MKPPTWAAALLPKPMGILPTHEGQTPLSAYITVEIPLPRREGLGEGLDTSLGVVATNDASLAYLSPRGESDFALLHQASAARTKP
jgi:hypothetical protein